MKKLLVVEDEESARQVMCKLLVSHGYDVVDAEDGPGALARFKEHEDISMVITDLTLPGMSGWDVAVAVRDARPDTPVIVLSGWDISVADEHIAASGVSMVLSKPVRVGELVKVIEELIGGN